MWLKPDIAFSSLQYSAIVVKNYENLLFEECLLKLQCPAVWGNSEVFVPNETIDSPPVFKDLPSPWTNGLGAESHGHACEVGKHLELD